MYINRVHFFRDSEEMDLLTYSVVVLTVRSFQNRETGCLGGDNVNRGTDWPSFNKNYFQLRVNDLDTTEYVIFTPSV